MSGVGSASRSSARIACAGKPRHVKRLNFGASILDLDAVHRVREQNGNAIVIQGSAWGIPCTEKLDYVRTWIETHDGNARETSFATPSSPVLGVLASKRVERSPVLGNRRKRPRVQAGCNESAASRLDRARAADAAGAAGAADAAGGRTYPTGPDGSRTGGKCEEDDEVPEKTPVESSLRRMPVGLRDFQRSSSPDLEKLSSKQEGGTERDGGKRSGRGETNRSDVLSAMSRVHSESIGKGSSPVLDKNSYSFKRRRRKVASRPRRLIDEYRADGKDECKDTNMNCVTIVPSADGDRVVPPAIGPVVRVGTRDVLNKKITSFVELLQSPTSDTKFSSVDSPRRSEISPGLRIESSDENERRGCKEDLNIMNDSDKTLSDIIEEVDTQDALPVAEIVRSCKSESRVPALERGSISFTACTRNSDETFCFKAEQLLRGVQGTGRAEEISQVLSSSRGTDKKSSQTDVTISMYSSPVRANSCPTMSVDILDSAKKRQKPKKGSVAEKLQSLINGQVSSIRIWRHQIKQSEFGNTSIQSVTVCVRECKTRFGRQFLAGIIIEDPFNLLENYVGTESFKSERFQKIYKGIEVMIVPDIVGKIQMRDEGVVKIYPPWEILDEQKTLLNVTYMNVLLPDESKQFLCNDTLTKVERKIIREDYKCACMESGGRLPSCEKHNNKPDVMEYLFSF